MYMYRDSYEWHLETEKSVVVTLPVCHRQNLGGFFSLVYKYILAHDDLYYSDDEEPHQNDPVHDTEEEK